MNITTFNNLTDAMLADEIGGLDVEAKALREHSDAAKAEFKTRGLGKAAGDRFTVTKAESVRWTLNTTAVKEEMGEDWVTKRSRQMPVVSLRITVNKAALAKAA